MATGVIRKRPRRKLPNVCRICLTGSSSMSDLVANFDSDQNITNLSVLEDVMCCSVTISESTPNHICSMCLSLLRISYNLKRQFEESQKRLFGKLIQKTSHVLKHDYELSEVEECRKTRTEVDIIVGKENYSLEDILIVEDEETDTFNYSSFLENLGKTISVEYLKNDSRTKINKTMTNSWKKKLRMIDKVENNRSEQVSLDILTNNLKDNDNDEYETIVIQTVSSDETDDAKSCYWEHEYAKNVTNGVSNVKKKGGRKSKYPKSLMKEINSLIIEGDAEHINNSEWSKEDINTNLEGELVKIKETKKRKREIVREMQEIEKYIIYGSGQDTPINVEKQSLADTYFHPNEVTDKMIRLDVMSLENDNQISVELDSAIMTDELVLEALNTKNICQQCSLAFATRISLKRHLHSVHGRKDVLLRQPTRQKISKEDRIKNRIEKFKQRFKNNPMLCQLCGYVSKSPGGARYHSLTHGEKMYKCDICSKRFFTPSHLKNHVQYKHEAKTLKHLCPLCGEYRNSATALSYHIKLHTEAERKFPCPICGIKFIVKSALNNHIRRHNGDRRCPCTICNKSFFSTNELKKHLMTHTGERPYKCKYCDKRFVTPFNQKVHMMTHDGPFLCENCHKGFIDLDMLNMHLKYKHRISVSDTRKIYQSDQEGNSNETQLLEELNLLPPEENNLYFEYA